MCDLLTFDTCSLPCVSLVPVCHQSPCSKRTEAHILSKHNQLVNTDKTGEHKY